MTQQLEKHFGITFEVPRMSEQLSGLARRNADLERQNRRLVLETRRLRKLVYLDPLTGLGNRRYFDMAAEAEMRRAARAGEPLTLLFCDVDNFKACNDTYGHEVGDIALIEIAGVLKEFRRRGGDLSARYAGDEFALLLPGVPFAAARQLAGELRAAVGALAIKHPRASLYDRVTISVGGASFDGKAPCPLSRLVDTADTALYRAKRAGRNRVAVASCSGTPRP